MQTQPDETHAGCTDGCCEEPPGFARAYWIGMGGLFGLVAIGALINAIVS